MTKKTLFVTNRDIAMWQRLSALLILCLIVVTQPVLAFAQQTQQQPVPQPPQGYYLPGPWHMWSDGYGRQFWWIFPLMMMLFMLVVCGAMFFFARGSHHGGPPWRMDRPWSDPSHSARQILSERFARGEIQKDEYEEKKATILSGGRH